MKYKWRKGPQLALASFFWNTLKVFYERPASESEYDEHDSFKTILSQTFSAQ
jgi:hypothetical protein